MQQTVPSKQHTFFEDEDQVTESQNLSVLPYEMEEKVEFQEEPSPPAELKEEFPSSKLPRSKRYLKITDAQRRDFIDAVENKGEKIIHAAKLFDINYSSAKSILNIYKNEGRMTKKPTRVKPDGTSPKTPEGNEKPKTVTTATVSTQTYDEEDKESLAYGSEKRANPYEGLSYHELSRFTGSINDYSGSQLQNSIPELNNKSSPPQNYPPINQPSQPIFTSINYLSLPNVSSISAPSLNQYTPMENSNLIHPGPGLIYPQINQNFSPESGAPRIQGLSILAAPCSIPQQEFQQSFVTPGASLDYSQLQRLQQNSGPMKEERAMPEFSNGMKNFAAMSYTGGDNNMSQAQFYQFPIKLNENNSKGLHQPATEIRYLPPIQMVLMPGTNQFDPNNAMIKPMFQMIGSNFVPQQNNYPYYENQNSNNNNNNIYPPNSN